jgi:hypothetical protein
MTEGSDNRDWRQFQDDVAEMLNLIPGCVARVNQPVHGARIGTVNVDVLAEFRDPRDPTDTTGPFSARGGHRFVFKVVVECKFWKRRIPQEKILALKTIVEDVGAALGVLISNAGVQQGGTDYLNHPGSVVAMTFEELQRAVAKGMTIETCPKCGTKVLCPFRTERAPYCRKCDAESKGSSCSRATACKRRDARAPDAGH